MARQNMVLCAGASLVQGVVSDLFLGLFVAMMAWWSWPGMVESARCRRLRGCRECTWLVPCDVALRQLCTELPGMRAQLPNYEYSSMIQIPGVPSPPVRIGELMEDVAPPPPAPLPAAAKPLPRPKSPPEPRPPTP